MADVITVSQLNRYVKSMLDREDALFDLALQGEIYNFVRNSRSGHCYFSLRDAECSVKAVMFRSEASRLAFRPEEGMRVVVRCRATLYERDGAFQVYVNAMFPDGIGAAQLALEQLKRKLEQEGLFDLDRKKPLPAYPRCIGPLQAKPVQHCRISATLSLVAGLQPSCCFVRSVFRGLKQRNRLHKPYKHLTKVDERM